MRNVRLRALGLALALSVVMALEGQARAGVSLVTSPSGIAANDSVDWGVLGPPFTDVSNPFTVNSVGGVGLTVSQASGDFLTMQQNTTWAGNFAPLDNLLWTQGGGPMTIDFNQALGAVGTQIQADFYGDFVARITALDSMGNAIGSFTEAGTSNGNSDGSAIFIGVAGGGIYGITLSLDSASNAPGDFAINTLLIGPGAVPEPSTLVLGAIAALGLGGYALRRKLRIAR
jgi:PEP-CTERM motif